MNSSLEESVPPDEVKQNEILRAEAHNLAVMAVQDTVLRIGWIFKTESVIIPAFMDVISGSPVHRGWLPILSRFGQSVIPLLLSDRIRRQPLKKRTLVVTGFLMAVPFLIISAICFSLEQRKTNWFPTLFLNLYFLFFAATGLNQLAYGSLQGKLIRPFRRGRLMAIGGALGSIGAVIAAIIWLQNWLAMPNNSGFAWIFLFNGSIFLISGIVSQFCREPPDHPEELAPQPDRQPLRDAWRLYRSDRAFRRAARVTMLFICTILLFPHYQWLAREFLHCDNQDLFYFVIAQTASVGVLSPLFGWIADRFGNRLAIRLEVFAASLTPLLAMTLASGAIPHARRWYFLVFVFLGLTPVTMRTILNYTLELTRPEYHARYQSTMTLCFALPFVFSPLLGYLIREETYMIAFSLTSTLIAAGGVLTFWMQEPRKQSE